MRITAIHATLLKERVLWAREVETIVTLRSLQPQASPPLHSKRMPWPGSVLVEIETDEGALGVGLGGGGRPGTWCVEHYLAPLLIDENPLDIERLWETMYRATYRHGQAGIMLMAISAVDLALWDLKGRVLGQPVWQLWGGKARDQVPVYATVRDALWAKERGFCGVKLGGPYGPKDGREGMRRNEAAVAALRERVGPDLNLMIDCIGGWTVEYTIEMARRLAPYRIDFLEEPLLSHDIEGYARLRRAIDSTLIACGEHVFTRYNVLPLLAAQAVDILQPDIRWTGGLSELIKIVDLASAYNVPVVPHRGGMAWSLHAIVARPECPLAEGLVLTKEEASYSLFDGEPVPVDGMLSVSDEPGFGLTLQKDRIERYIGEI
jgi:L-rhamnonate dehydratase